MAQGHPIETVIFFLSFLYSCLRLERQETMACFEEEQVETLVPPGMKAIIDPVTAIWLRRLSNLLIMTVGVKQLTLITISCSLSVISHALLANTIPALQIKRSIFQFLSRRKSNNFSTEDLSLKSAFWHSQLPPNQEISALISLNSSLLRSMIIILHLYSRASSSTIYLPIPMHAPVITTKLFLSSFTGSFLPKSLLRMCVKMIVSTTIEVVVAKILKMLNILKDINYIIKLQSTHLFYLPLSSLVASSFRLLWLSFLVAQSKAEFHHHPLPSLFLSSIIFYHLS